MENTPVSPTPISAKPPFVATKVLYIAAVLGLVVGGFCIYWFGFRDHTPHVGMTDEFKDPRLTYPTRYKNVHPDVKYVPDEQCAQCHKGHAESYKHHAMGQSFGTFATLPVIENYELPQKFNSKDGFQYEIKTKKDEAGKIVAVTHHERKIDKEGKVIFEQEMPVEYVFGSGSRGRSYLTRLGDRLFESPISWYSQKKIWDLSPGYETVNQHFQRMVIPECLHCHVNRFDHVPLTENRYQGEIFHGLAIGCQRCHGPGELHVKFRKENPDAGGEDYTIVNPGDLAPALRDAVCEQCHLHGKVDVKRIGRSKTDFRPGLPLDLFVTYFTGGSDSMDDAVGQVEQMHASVCFKKSNGKLGCISCHDPHGEPDSKVKAAYFRQRCQTCHKPNENDCLVSIAKRTAANSDNCFLCHMPRYAAADVVHTSITDHRIVRVPAKPKDHVQPTLQEFLTPFHQSESASKDSELERDRGVALADMAFKMKSKDLAVNALKRLEKLPDTWPTDFFAMDRQAVALYVLDMRYESLKATERILELSPNLESALLPGATISWDMNRASQAIHFGERLVKLNPYNANAHYALSEYYFNEKKYPQAYQHAREAVHVMPSYRGARKIMIRSLVMLGKLEEAENELATFARFEPDPRDLVSLRHLVSEKK